MSCTKAFDARARRAAVIVAWVALNVGCNTDDDLVRVVFRSDRSIPEAAERLEVATIVAETGEELDRRSFDLSTLGEFPAEVTMRPGPSTPVAVRVYARLFVGRSVVARGEDEVRFVGGSNSSVGIELFDSPDTLPCGTTPLLTDAFADGVPTGWLPYQEGVPGYFLERDGYVRFEPVTDQIGDLGYRSAEAYDLVGGFVSVRPGYLPWPGSPSMPRLTVASARSNDRAAIEYLAGQLRFWSESDGNRTILSSIPFDRVPVYDPAVWQISADSTSMRWETSIDGTTWDLRASMPTPAWARSVRSDLGIEAPPLASPGYVTFSNYNGGAVRHPVGWCPVSTLIDTFDDDPTSPWATDPVDANCGFVTIDGRLVVDLAPAAKCEAFTLSRVDLRGDTFTVEPFAIPSGSELEIALRSNTNNYKIAMVAAEGQLVFRVSSSDATTLAGEIEYDLTTDRYWRIRETSGTVYFETSANNHRFTVRAQLEAVPDLLDAMKASVQFRSVAQTTVRAEIGGLNPPRP